MKNKMKQSKSIKQFKRDITRGYIQYDNETLINMLNEGKRDELIKSLLPMVIYVAGKFNSSNEFDEIVSVGNLGLIKGIDNFNTDRSDNIVSYCRSTIKWSILDYFNIDKNIIRLPQSKNVSQKTLNSRPTTIDFEGMELYQIEDDSVLYEEKKINRGELEELLMTIPKMKYSKVMLFLDYYLIPGMTFTIVSEKNGFTKQNASLVVLEMLKKIKSNPQLMDRFREILL
jgi:RNA polymerase sigma factor (sigma-70 family)